MNIYINAEKNAYTDWCGMVVANLFNSRKITFNGIEIDEVEVNAVDDKRIYLSIFKLPFTIRIWNNIPCDEECDEDYCVETVGYTFYCSAINECTDYTIPSGDGEALCGGYLKMKWAYDELH